MRSCSRTCCERDTSTRAIGLRQGVCAASLSAFWGSSADAVEEVPCVVRGPLGASQYPRFDTVLTPTPCPAHGRGVIALSRLPNLCHVSIIGCGGVRALAGSDFPNNPCLKIFTRVQLGDDD